MNYYARIVTTDPSAIVWSVDYVHAILGELNTIPNVTFAVDIVYRDLVPEVINERISHAFMDTLREGGADFIWLHISEAQRKKWGLKPTLRGLNHRDRDSVGEMYFWADEGTKRGRYIQFIETALHEIRHEIMKGSGQYDNTHEIHPTSKSLLGTFKDINMSTYRPLRQLQRTLFHRLLDRLLASIKPTGEHGLKPKVQRAADAVVAEMKRRGHEVRIVEGFRTFERQTELYNQGRTTPGAVVTNAKAGQSLHNYGVAADFVFRREGYNASDTLWALLGDVGKKQGFEWGGDWKGFVDKPHFEMRLGHSLKDFQNNKVDWKKYQV